MSSRTIQNEKFADSKMSKTNVLNETGQSCVKKSESSTCESSNIASVSPEIGSETFNPGDHQSKIRLQATSRQEANDIQEDSTDSTYLFDGQTNGSQTNGEDCFENENVFQTDNDLQSRVHDEVASSEPSGSKEESSSMDSIEEDPRNVRKSGTKDVRPQSEVILNPLLLQTSASRTLSSSNEELEINPSGSVCYKKQSSTRPYSCPTAEQRQDEVGPTTSVCCIEPGTRQHANPTATLSRMELGPNSPSSYRLGKQTGAGKHSSRGAEQGREELAGEPSLSVRFIKPGGVRQHQPSLITECSRENRDIFETGGEQSKHQPPAGVSCAAGFEDIELLPGGSPESQAVTSQTQSDEAPRPSLCQIAKVFVCRCLTYPLHRICWQFAKAPVFYLVSTLVILAGINAWDKAWLDEDISIAITVSFSMFVVITFFFDRGQFVSVIGGQRSCIVECRRGCRNADPCIPVRCCGCRGSPASLVERHSQYRHLQEDGAFEHEIADVSNLDPKDCPQMKMVEQREFEHAESPERPPEVSQVNADVHVGKRDGEKLGASRRHLGRSAAAPTQTTKPHKTRSAMPRPKTFKANIHSADHVVSDPPALSPISETDLEDPKRKDTSTMGPARRTSICSDDVSRVEGLPSGGSRTTSNSPVRSTEEVFKKFSECTPPLPRFANVRPQSSADSSSDSSRVESEQRSTSPDDESLYEHVPEVPEEEFVCEHYGQSVACSCAIFLGKDRVRR